MRRSLVMLLLILLMLLLVVRESTNHGSSPSSAGVFSVGTRVEEGGRRLCRGSSRRVGESGASIDGRSSQRSDRVSVRRLP